MVTTSVRLRGGDEVALRVPLDLLALCAAKPLKALLYRLRGEDEPAKNALDALSAVQHSSGLFLAATDDLANGFELFDGLPRGHSTDPHIASAAWFVLAVNGWNPYACCSERLCSTRRCANARNPVRRDL